MNKSESKGRFGIFFKYHHTIPMMNMWCHDKFESVFSVFRISLPQTDIWSTGTLYHPIIFSFELKSLHTNFASADSKNAISPHSSLSKCKKDTYANFCKGITSFIFPSIFLSFLWDQYELA